MLTLFVYIAWQQQHCDNAIHDHREQREDAALAFQLKKNVKIFNND